MSSCAVLVELPEGIREELARQKQLGVDFENRSFNRVVAYCEGFLKITSQPRVLKEAQGSSTEICGGAVVKDISRNGIGVYFHEQLYPLQKFEVEFQGRSISALVVRCRFISKNCYEVGAIIQSVLSNRK
jgi:hypothetical protein